MHTRHGNDQADGLRRLMVGDPTRLITVVGAKAGVGRTSMTINLAAALAGAGKDVLVLDENQAPNNLVDRLMLSPHTELLDVAQGRCELRQVMQSSLGFSVLPAARAIRALGRLSSTELQRLENALTEASNGADVMLVDAATLAGDSSVSSALASGVSMLVVVDATVSGITETYTMIKRLALENARLNFEVVVNRVHNEAEAINVFGNMARVARRHLTAHLDYLGYIPADAKLARANQLGRAVVEAFPTSHSAQAYVELVQHSLLQGTGHDETKGGVSGMLKSLVRQMRSEAIA